MTKGNKFSSSMTDVPENCLSFVSNHHVKIALGVPIQISTVIRSLENISFLLQHFEVTSSFCMRNSLPL